MNYEKERKKLIKFIHHFHFLTEEQRKEICVTIIEPYSWNVVFFEVLNDTELSRKMLDNIDWEKLDET